MSDEADDLDARIIARAAHLLAPPPPTPAQRIAALEAELARERVRSEAAEARVRALEDQIEHAGCSAAHEGERTYECRIDAPCGLCRLRARAEAAERDLSKLFHRALGYRRALLEANRRRRADRASDEARERELEALGFERPGPSAYTCGDALGLRRLLEVEPQFPTPDVDEDPPDPAKTPPI